MGLRLRVGGKSVPRRSRKDTATAWPLQAFLGTLWAVRCHAYVLPSEVYRDLEPQILEQLRGPRDRLLYLLEEHDLAVELLSGEWRVLFSATEDFYQVVEPDKHRFRMAVSPDELADFVKLLRDPQQVRTWEPVSFGLDELRDVLPPGCDLAGVVFVEEPDDWLWSEQVNEIIAMPEDVFELLQPHAQMLLRRGELPALSRLAGDHGEGAVEFNGERWSTLREQAREKVPELLGVFESRLSTPGDYTAVREALAVVADPQFQPSLDAWLRILGREGRYALFFRDVEAEHEALDDLEDEDEDDEGEGAD